MSVFQSAYDAHLTISGHEITWREILGNALRLGLGDRWHAPQGVGLAGRDHRQRPAVHGLHRDRGLNDQHSPLSGRPAGRSSSSSSASTAGGAGEPAKKPVGRRGRSGRRAALGDGAERTAYLIIAGAGRRLVLFVVFKQIGAVWPARPGTSSPTPGSSSARSSRPTRWRAAGSTSGCAGSRSTWSACPSCSTSSSTRRRCCTPSTACW